MNIEIILAQFGSKHTEINPSYSSMRKYFPTATFKIYTDSPVKFSGTENIVVSSIFDKNHYRYGNRSNDYYKVKAISGSTADIAICIDSDMFVISDMVTRILSLTKGFGFCIPCNPRYMVRNDTLIGEDSDRALDETQGAAFALNMSPISFCPKNIRAKEVLNSYCNKMERSPVRGPLAMWRAIWETKFYPCLLPPQWCVCQEHCGIGNEIILHVGHQKVKEFYHI